MAEGAGLENRYTCKGIVGSNPTLSVMTFAPGDCLLTGLCGVQAYVSAVPPGLGFIAVGLIIFGTRGLWRLRKPR